MRPGRKPRLISQLLIGQIILLTVAAVTLVGTASVVAPSIFRRHMIEAGIDTSVAQAHIGDAFSGAFNLSLMIAIFTSLIISGIIAWYLMRRITQPIEILALAAERLARGEEINEIEGGGSSPEIDRLASALKGMSSELSKIQDDQARMLRDLAHELRTPIATVGALVDGIEDGVVAANAHSWNTIRDQLQRLNRLSRDVRDVSDSYDQGLSTEKTLTNPVEIGNSAVSAWRPRYEGKGVTLEVIVSAELSWIDADPLRIGQILSNLLENSLRYTPKAGKVQLIIGGEDGEVAFTVRDTGEGIASSHLPHIFDRLYRGESSRSAGGSGLGLSIARSIAESHAGTLTALSEGRGQGSTFTLTLPST